MAEKTLPPAAPHLYLRDETAWLEQTAALVAQRRFGEIDPDHLSEYLSDMARRDRREVLSRLAVLLAHLLKWDLQPDRRSGSWEATIEHQRQELQDLLEDRTLRNHARDVLAKAYERARRQAALETGSAPDAPPQTCPWALDEIVPAGEEPTD
jgi:hypothetical protein